MNQIDICNNALDLSGQGLHIESLEEQSKEADLSNRLFALTLQRALDKYNWSFATKDEYITDDFLLEDVVSLPWRFTYTLPEDVRRVLYILPNGATSIDETGNAETYVRFSLRNHNNQRVIATDEQAPWYLRYQAIITDLDILPPTFVEALEYLLASRFATELMKGETGLKFGTSLYQTGMQLLQYAIGLDAQQGQESLKNILAPSFIRGRGGRFQETQQFSHLSFRKVR